MNWFRTVSTLLALFMSNKYCRFDFSIPIAWVVRIFVCLLAISLGVWVEYRNPEYAERLDNAVRDVFLQLSVEEQSESRLVIVDIGEDALAEIGVWPWKRTKIADLVEILLSDYRAQSVALDIVFPDRADSEGDARLTLLASFAPFVLSQVFDYTTRTQVLAQGVLSGGVSMPADANAAIGSGYIANHAALAGARCVGNIGYLPDIDGVVRRIPLFTQFQGRAYPHLSHTMLNCVQHNMQIWGDSNRATGGFWRVPYRRAISSYAVVSAADVLNRRAPIDLIAHRYVLVGSSALGLGDRVSTPLSSLVPGFMVHAASLSGLLDIQEGKTREAWSGQTFIVLWIVLTVFFVVMLMAKLSALSSTLMLLGCVAVWIIVAFVGMLNQGEGSVSAPLFAYLVLLVIAVPHEWWRSQRTAKRLFNTFSHYVAESVLHELMRKGAEYSLTPTLREVTVLIADMEGYTQATSSLSLTDAATLTKDFLDCLTRPVIARRGTLDKYTGDGLVAFWGAPLDCDDHADQAVTAAIEILHEVDKLSERRKQRSLPSIKVRIGIESGKALVGDLGTPFRSTYTAVGDCINFASRLEVAARNLSVQVVIGPIAHDLLRQHKTVSLGRHTLRGTSAEIDLFTPEAEYYSLFRSD